MLATWVSTGETHHDDDGHTQAFIAFAWVIKMKSLSYGESLNVVQKVRLLFLICSFLFVGIISTREGGTVVRRELLLNEEARVARRSSNIVLCYIPGTRWRTGDGGRWVDRKGLDKERDEAVRFLVLIKKSFFI